jgi:hypothetical protein
MYRIRTNNYILVKSWNVPDRESLLEDEHQGNHDQDPVFPHSEKPESIVLDGL